MNGSSQIAISAHAMWKYDKNRPKCYQIATISIVLCEVDIVEDDGNSRCLTKSGNATDSVHAKLKKG